MACERGMRRDKTGFSSHNLYKADAVNCRSRFNVRRFNNIYSFCHSGIKPKGTINDYKVIVNSFGDSDKGDFQASFVNFFRYIYGTALSPVSTDYKDHIQVKPFHCINNLNDFSPSASGASQKCSAQLMNIINNMGFKLYYIKLLIRQETKITVTYTGNSSNSVTIPKTAYNGADYIVNTGTETAAAYNARVYVSRHKINILTGPCALQFM